VQKLTKIQQLFESCWEVISDGSERARKEKGPEARRRRAGDLLMRYNPISEEATRVPFSQPLAVDFCQVFIKCKINVP
jgi:hypothetical protein